MTSLRGGVALVTGGASGIGLATVARLRAAGMRVAVADLAAPPHGSSDLAVETDVADPDAWPGLVERVTGELGGLDAVHLNAGVGAFVADLAGIDEDAYRRVMRVNVDHVFFGLRACSAVMAAHGSGRIVATASLAGLTPMASDPVYTASKHAVVGLVRAVAPGLAARGVIVNAVCPGIVDTPLIAGHRVLLVDAGFPLLEADDVAAAVIHALTEGGPGDCIHVQPGREPGAYRFAGIPGPRVPGKEGVRPPV